MMHHTEEPGILNRLTEYCYDINNYETDGEPTLRKCPQTVDEDTIPILRKEVEAKVKARKVVKSAGVDNVTAELVNAGGDAMIDVMT